MKKFITSLFSLVALMTLVSLTGCSGNGIEGTWKADQETIKSLLGNEVKNAKKAEMTVTISGDKLDVAIELDAEQEGLGIGVKANLMNTYTKTDTEITLTPVDAKAEVTNLTIPENMKALLEASGMTEDKMKEEIAKEFKPNFLGDKASKMSYVLEGDKLTLKDLAPNGITIVLTR